MDFKPKLIEGHCYVTLIDRNLQHSVIFRHVYKISKSDYYLRHVCPSDRTPAHVELRSHWTDFHEI